jgi:hypothetical protein
MVALALCLLLNAGENDDEYAVSDRPVQTMTRHELKLELQQLDERRPGLGGPITMVSIGGTLLLDGAFLLLSTRSAFSGGGFPIGYIFVAILAVGTGLLVPGIWLLWTRREPRAVFGERMDAITSQLDSLDHAGGRRDDGRRGRGEGEDPPPQPPPPPGEGYQL